MLYSKIYKCRKFTYKWTSLTLLLFTEDAMAISYKRLWKLLIDKDLKKKDLEDRAGISHYTVSKLNRGDNVTTDVLARICTALDCTMDDILEIIPENNSDNNMNV